MSAVGTLTGAGRAETKQIAGTNEQVQARWLWGEEGGGDAASMGTEFKRKKAPPGYV